MRSVAAALDADADETANVEAPPPNCAMVSPLVCFLLLLLLLLPLLRAAERQGETEGSSEASERAFPLCSREKSAERKKKK